MAALSGTLTISPGNKPESVETEPDVWVDITIGSRESDLFALRGSGHMGVAWEPESLEPDHGGTSGNRGVINTHDTTDLSTLSAFGYKRAEVRHGMLHGWRMDCERCSGFES